MIYMQGHTFHNIALVINLLANCKIVYFIKIIFIDFILNI